MRTRKNIIVITGVPGTGKTAFSNSLEKKLKNTEVIHVTDIVNKEKLFSSYARDGSKIVKMSKLRARLEQMIENSRKKILILESHLLCDMKIRNAKAIVLREHLSVLRRRLIKRGYGKEKLNTNLISEATDYCGIRAERNYDYVFETFARNKSAVANVMRIIKGKKPKAKSINLMPELERMIKTDKSLLA